MKQCIGLALVFLSWHANAAFNLATKLEIDGKLDVSPTITIKSSKWNTVVENDVTLKVKATEAGTDSVKINVKIYKGSMDKKGKIASSEIIANWNEPASISVADNDKGLSYRFTVTPLKEKSLERLP